MVGNAKFYTMVTNYTSEAQHCTYYFRLCFAENTCLEA